MFADKRMELGSHLRKLPMGYFTSGNIGKISSVLSTDVYKRQLSYFYKILNDYFEAGEIEVYQKKLLDGISKVNICLLYTSRCV